MSIFLIIIIHRPCTICVTFLWHSISWCCMTCGGARSKYMSGTVIDIEKVLREEIHYLYFVDTHVFLLLQSFRSVSFDLYQY